MDSVSDSGAGSSSNDGGWRSCFGSPERVNAPIFLRNVVRDITGRAILSDTFLRMTLCWLYLVHSHKMYSLVWSVSLSQLQEVRSSA